MVKNFETLLRIYNLPTQLTSFVGRTAEIDSILERLRNDTCQLLTLVGAGGIGKTRLAIEVVQHLTVFDFQHGVYYVPLAPLTSPDMIATSIISTLGMTLSHDDDLQTTLIKALRHRNALLILDNFEHVMGGVGLVHEILTHAPDVKILVTSREPLNLTTEWLEHIKGMDHPDTIPHDIQAFSALQLFNERALMVDGHFSIQHNLRDVMRICDLVDGMPLAIELAASWLKSLSCTHIVHQIETGIDFLKTTTHNLPTRHHSIRAVFDHSWHLLSADMQHVFPRLSIFRGGFTLEGAMAVADTHLLVISALVEKSMIRRGQHSRYDIHELLRQYGAQKLEDAGDYPDMLDAHIHYFSGFMLHRVADLKGKRQIDALHEIQADFDNIIEAWRNACNQADYEAIDQMLACWVVYFDIIRYPLVANEIYRYAIAHLHKPKTDAEHRIYNHLHIAELYTIYRQSNQGLPYDKLADKAHHYQQTARQYDDLIGVILCLLIQSHLVVQPELPPETLEAMTVSEQLGDPYFIGMVIDLVAFYYTIVNKHQHDMVQTFAGRYLRVAQASNNIDGISTANFHYAQYHRFWGDLSQAKYYIEMAVEGYQKIGHRQGQLVGMGLLADFQFRLGEFEEIEDKFIRIWHGLEALGFMATHSYNLMLRAKLKAIEGEYQQGKQLLVQTVGYQTNMATHVMIHQAQMMCAIGEGDYQTVRYEATEVLNIDPVFVDDRTGTDFVLLIAFLYHAEDEYNKAIQLLALAFNHPKAALGWAKRWTLVTDLHHHLKNEVSQTKFDQQWEKGQRLDLRHAMDDIRTYLNNNTRESNNTHLVETLTRRELDVLSHIVKGKRNKEIAKALGISVGTVKSHVFNMCQKLDVDNRVELTLRAQELNLLD